MVLVSSKLLIDINENEEIFLDATLNPLKSLKHFTKLSYPYTKMFSTVYTLLLNYT
jgi:hypothetical protein